MSAEPTAILMEYLSDDAGALYTYLGGAYVAAPVAPDGWDNTHRAVIFQRETEGTEIAGAHNRTVFVFRCYGGNARYDAAGAVFRALRDYLHCARGVVTSAGTLMLARLVTAFDGPADPETGWPVMIAKFEVTTAA